MRFLVSLLLVISITGVAQAKKKSDLVDVDKDSKLSTYFSKINKKVTADSETKELPKPKPKQDEISEDKILLNAAAEKPTETQGLSPINKMMLTVFGLIFMALLCFGIVQKMARKKGHSEIGKNIKILTQKPIGPKKNLMLIRVAGETILLGVTDQNINHIKTLSLMDDELPQYTEPKFKNQLKEKIEQTRISDEVEEVDGFSVSRLDDVKKAVTQRFTI